ncbi:Sec39 domain-containing protein [Limtongia smithiae]|uniref:Sec39 domain-containing protein n=1 Tax=Limtongia smithiae TaxID=1125753 RepID=UPI0034CED9D5
MHGDAATALHVVRLASRARISALRKLLVSRPLPLTTVLRLLLLFLPCTCDPDTYLPLVRALAYGEELKEEEDEEAGDTDADDGDIVPLDEHLARVVVDRLVASEIARIATSVYDYIYTDAEESSSTAVFTAWLFARIYAIAAMLPVLSLVDAVVATNAVMVPLDVVRWRDGVLLPLARYLTYYPSYGEDEDELSTQSLHALTTTDHALVIARFLRHSTAKTITRDVTALIMPFITYISSLQPSAVSDKLLWRAFFAHIVHHAAADFEIVTELVRQWEGPAGGAGAAAVSYDADVQREYVAAIVAACYACEDTTAERFDAMHTLQKRAHAILMGCGGGVESKGTVSRNVDDAFRYPGSALYAASETTLYALDQLVTSAAMLSVYVPTSLRDVATLRYCASHEAEFQFLMRVVRGKAKEFAYRDDSNWRSLRSSARWLKNKSLVLAKLTDEDIDNIFLGALLDFGRINLVREIYIDPVHTPLALEDVERHVLKSFNEHYDAASNCNATRGSLRTAAQVLHLIYPGLSASPRLQHAEQLILATHELSKYSLTLVHGTPLAPLQIRAHGKPEEITALLLQANEKAYLQVNELVTITRNLIAGLTGESPCENDGVEYRVTRMCVYSALAADDFATAYQYCMTRLWAQAAAIAKVDGDLIWQVFFAAGRYVSPNTPAGTPSPSLSMGGGGAGALATMRASPRVKHLALQMELLARAMDICPEKHVFEILNVWQDFELQVVQYTVAVQVV